MSAEAEYSAGMITYAELYADYDWNRKREAAMPLEIQTATTEELQNEMKALTARGKSIYGELLKRYKAEEDNAKEN